MAEKISQAFLLIEEFNLSFFGGTLFPADEEYGPNTLGPFRENHKLRWKDKHPLGIKDALDLEGAIFQVDHFQAIGY